MNKKSLMALIYCFSISIHAGVQSLEPARSAPHLSYAEIVRITVIALDKAKNNTVDEKEKETSWQRVLRALKNHNLTLDEKEKTTMEALKRLTNYYLHETDSLENSNYDKSPGDDEGQAVPKPSLKDQDEQIISSTAFRLSSLKQPSVSVDSKLQQYLEGSKIIDCHIESSTRKDEIRKAMKEGIEEWIGKNNGKWPGKDVLGVKEQFYWNVMPTSLSSIKDLFAAINPLNYQKFLDFCAPYLQGLAPYDKPSRMQTVLPIYQAFPEDDNARRGFMNFCDPYLQGLRPQDKPSNMERILPIYQAFSDDNVRRGFVNFCDPYLEKLNYSDKVFCMKDLFPIYQAYPEDNEARRGFVNFCDPYLSVATSDKSSHMKMLLPIYQAFPNDNDARREFLDFCAPYLAGLSADHKPSHMKILLLTYQAFPEDNARRGFLAFCAPYLQHSVAISDKPSLMYMLLPIYQAFPEDNARRGFMAFCSPYLQHSVITSDNTFQMYSLLPIYQAFPDDNARRGFLDFCDPYLEKLNHSDPYLEKLNHSDKVSSMQKLLPIYQDFPDDNARRGFIAFCDPYLQRLNFFDNVPIMPNLFPIYQAYPEDNVRRGFLDFCDPYLQRLNFFGKLPIMQNLLHIYQSPLLREDFRLYMRPHLGELNLSKRSVTRELVAHYLNRTYLFSERALAALKTETAPPVRRVESLYYETKLYHSLPAFFAADPLLVQQRAKQGNVNAHEFEELYEIDREALFTYCENKGYKAKESTIKRTIFNGANSLENYTTQSEVEDFINYLDEISKEGRPFKIDGKSIEAIDVVSMIKQMLGLEQKKDITTDDFAPYLGHSMFYANPNAPKGDDMIGRVWFMMKQLGQEGIDNALGQSNEEIEKALKDAENYKMSMILAMLDALEISKTRVDTHCQTRITGELMKLICWHLEGSKLRPFIAGNDLPPVATDIDMQMRITSAPDRAKILFDRLKKEDTGAIRTLLENNPDPELWERYRAYYDELYRRTRVLNEDGSFKEFKKDDHILMRDNRGNLVSLYNADGSLRDIPVIIYYQVEFQVFEQTFTELMRKQFEEQRGLIY